MAIVFPLKYHIHASCGTGKGVCLATLLLTVLLTIISEDHTLIITIIIIIIIIINIIIPGYLLGVVPPHLGREPMDHFKLVSTHKFVIMITIPFFICLVVSSLLFIDSFMAER